MSYKVLNLYACLGGNRYKWTDCEVTAVELDPVCAELYQERFPNDTVIVADAHQYLLEHYKEFDFIWSSPPCPSHSRVRLSQKNRDTFVAIYPEMKLYEEIIFLETYFDGMFCVENVIPYYEPLIPAQKRGRHLYWTNFKLPIDLNGRKELNGVFGGMSSNEVKKLSKLHDYDFRKYKGEQRVDKMARNLVDYEVGKTILDVARNNYRSKNTKQMSML